MKSASIFAFALLTALTSASPSMSRPCDHTVVWAAPTSTSVNCDGFPGDGGAPTIYR